MKCSDAGAALHFSETCPTRLYIHMLRILFDGYYEHREGVARGSEKITGTCLSTRTSSFLDNSQGHQALPAVYGKVIRLYLKGITHCRCHDFFGWKSEIHICDILIPYIHAFSLDDDT